MSPFRYIVVNTSVVRKLYIGFAGVIFSIVVMIGYAYHNSQEESKILDCNRHTYQIMQHTDGLLVSLINMETGIRGYIVTEEPLFLSPYQQGKAEFEEHLMDLKSLVIEDPLLQSRIAELERLEKEWNQKILLPGKVPDNDIMFERKRQMDEMRAILRAITADQRQMLADRSLILEESKNRLRQMLIAGGFLSLGLLAVIIPALVLDLKARKRKEDTLKELNEGLERKVYERTIALSDMNAMLEEEVSERQAAEDLLLDNHQALLVSENRYRGLFDHMKKAFIYCKLLLDRDGAVIDGEILDVNHSFIEQFCRFVPEFSWSGRKISEVSCNELKLVFDCLKEYGSQVLQPTSLSFERILEVGDKCYQISAYSPEPYYLAILITDITEQRRITAEVEENRRRYEALMMQSSEAVLVVDFNSKIITEANNASLRVFGYEREELLSMPLSDLLMISEDSLQSLVAMLARFGGLPAAIRSCRRKDGSKIQLERVASLIEYSGKRLILISYRDVTEQQKLQAILQGELELAGTMQKSLLPAEFNNELVAIRTVFQPLHFVSGDYYGYKWSRSNKQLHGYIIDVTGHGIATALHTASISSLLNETMEKEQGWTPTAFLELNRYCLEYFPENAFVAMIAFTFDFTKQTLTYITGGINYIIACTQSDIGLMPLRGLYLGITDDPDFEFVTIPLQHGDLFYFMTDGIYERLPDSFFNGICQFSETVEALKRLSQDGQRFDDCSALCIEVRAWPEKKQHFNFSNDEYTVLRRDQVNERLYKLAGSEGPKLEIVLGEAINNALAYGTKVKVTIQKIGQRLVIRVKDDGPGFLGNAVIESLGNQSRPELFETKLDAECGRGLGIMAAWTDKVLYSQRGNEVLIIKNLT